MSNKPSKDGEVLPIVHNLLKNSSSHGLPNIYSSRNVVAKLFWGMVFCAGLCLMFWQVYTLFEAYFAYEYIVGLEVRYNKTLPFPAVTICNLNPVLKSKLEEADESFRDKFDSNYVPPKDKDTQDDKNNMVTSSSLTSATNDDGGSSQGTRMDGETTTQAVNTTEPVKSWDELENTEYFTGQSAEYKQRQKLTIALSDMTLDERHRIGHSLQDMLLDCTWKGYPCSPTNFTRFYHYRYGNCYTFNNGQLSSILTTNKPGPNYGLSLELFVDQSEYMDDITDSAGLRISIHDPNKMPFPEDDGLYIGPGQRTSISTRVMEIDRLGKPWGDCTDVNNYNTTNIYINMYNVSYSMQACERSCYQYSVIEQCSCADTNFPFPVELLNLVPCDTEDNETARICIENMEAKYDNDELMCSCNQTCEEEIYLTSISQSEWPSQGYQNTLFKRMEERNSKMRSNVKGPEADDWTKRNVAKLDVYFMELNYQYIKQSPAYEVKDLLSDIGGQLGLWIGVSVVTLMEMMQLVGAVFGALFAKLHGPHSDPKIFPST
ncbi:degenerin-like protein asic-1 [Anneissia japonica]|uniref:degenerin-like protein asic-1 n=1 Tax=Anneissia japonica TaxID=1529436 RepID=UPI0014259DA6|nr:degenerin-like protein asic-1 [Anneissia japonica]